MKLISYRGNINGSDPKVENTISYIDDALSEGYIVAIDVWLDNGKLYLCTSRPSIYTTSRSRGYRTGAPYYEIDESYLENSMILVRAGNADTLVRLVKNGRIHCFHTDKHSAITSRGFLWTTSNVSGLNVIRMSTGGDPVSPCYAVCSSYVRNYGRPDADQAILIPEKLAQIREAREQGDFLEQELAELDAALEVRREELAKKESEYSETTGLLKQIQRRLLVIGELIDEQ
jgi:hypothetical protein